MNTELAEAHAVKWSREEIQQRVDALGQWFQNIDLHGVQTAPAHFLGDYPSVKWRRFADALPQDLRGKTVLDIGCNAGFYSIEMKRRGAERVVGVDFDERYLAQAQVRGRGARDGHRIPQLSVYDVAQLGEKFDVVIFMGVLYHLRHPLLALDLIREHAAKDLLVFQSMQRGSREAAPVKQDYTFWQTEIFERPDFPLMYFIENKYAGDPTNWWIPNRACVEAMLRSARFAILSHPEEEVFLCRCEREPKTRND